MPTKDALIAQLRAKIKAHAETSQELGQSLHDLIGELRQLDPGTLLSVDFMKVPVTPADHIARLQVSLSHVTALTSRLASLHDSLVKTRVANSNSSDDN